MNQSHWFVDLSLRYGIGHELVFSGFKVYLRFFPDAGTSRRSLDRLFAFSLVEFKGLMMFLVKFAFALGCISFVSTQFIYLNSGVFKFISGLGLPIDVGLTGGSMSWFVNFQVFYKLPDNVTYFEPYKVVQKRSVKDTLTRPNLYKAFIKYFERLGFFGDDCVRRVICEVASRQINRDENGLLGEVIDILFSPGNDVEGLEEHKAAQWQGFYNGSACGVLYKDCHIEDNSIFLY